MPKIDWSLFETYEQLTGREKTILKGNIVRMDLNITPKEYFEHLKNGLLYCKIHSAFLPKEKFHENNKKGPFCKIHSWVAVRFTFMYKGQKMTAAKRLEVMLDMMKFETKTCKCGSKFVSRKGHERVKCSTCLYKQPALKRWERK